jgi:hypothetical protein
MKDEAQSQLRKIMDVYDAKFAEAERLAAANRAAQAAFPGRFSSLGRRSFAPCSRR